MTYVNGKSVIAIGVILPVLGIASILSRFRARVARKAAVGLDDWLCLAALVSPGSWLRMISIDKETGIGFGDRLWNHDYHR